MTCLTCLLSAAAVCRFVELDRCIAAAEAGYAVGLFKVLQADSMAKNDLLVGLPLPTAPTAAAAKASAPAPGRETSPAAVPETVQYSTSPAGLVPQQEADSAAASELSKLALDADVASCLCRCGQALCSRGVLFSQERLQAACTK